MKSKSSALCAATQVAAIVSVVVVPLLVLFLCVTAAAPARADDGSSKGGMTGMSDQDMQKMMEMMKPGPNHEALGRLAGNWKTKISMWMGPGEPTTDEGTATYEWVLDKHYLMNHQSGMFSGMPFKGMGIDGYDNGKKQFFSCWYDNMGTGLMYLTGQADADGKGWSLSGTMFEPVQGKDIPLRTTTRLEGNDKYVYSMYSSSPGPDGKMQEMKMMEITATRTQ